MFEIICTGGVEDVRGSVTLMLGGETMLRLATGGVDVGGEVAAGGADSGVKATSECWVAV